MFYVEVHDGRIQTELLSAGCEYVSLFLLDVSYILTVPVDSALVNHSRSLSLNGRRTRLTPCLMSTALSGYRKWCVVLFPTSFSNPWVTALFILGKKNGEEDEEEKHGNGEKCLLGHTTHTVLRSGGSQSARRFLSVAACRSCRLLRSYGSGRGRA